MNNKTTVLEYLGRDPSECTWEGAVTDGDGCSIHECFLEIAGYMILIPSLLLVFEHGSAQIIGLPMTVLQHILNIVTAIGVLAVGIWTGLKIKAK